jgi:hypothetical protein
MQSIGSGPENQPSRHQRRMASKPWKLPLRRRPVRRPEWVRKHASADNRVHRGDRQTSSRCGDSVTPFPGRLSDGVKKRSY